MKETLSKEEIQSEPKWKTRLRQMGIAGFLFFTIKGLLWLIIPFLIAKGCIGNE